MKNKVQIIMQLDKQYVELTNNNLSLFWQGGEVHYYPVQHKHQQSHFNSYWRSVKQQFKLWIEWVNGFAQRLQRYQADPRVDSCDYRINVS